MIPKPTKKKKKFIDQVLKITERRDNSNIYKLLYVGYIRILI